LIVLIVFHQFLLPRPKNHSRGYGLYDVSSQLAGIL